MLALDSGGLNILDKGATPLYTTPDFLLYYIKLKSKHIMKFNFIRKIIQRGSVENLFLHVLFFIMTGFTLGLVLDMIRVYIKYLMDK